MKGSGSWRLCKTAAFFRRKPFRRAWKPVLQYKARGGAVSVPRECRAGFCRVLEDPPDTKQQCPLRRPCRQLPLQGSLSSGGFKCLPCKGRWMRRRRRRRGAAPDLASILPDRRTSPAPASVRQLALVRNRRVRTFQAPRDDAGGVPRECRAGFCRVLEDPPDTKQQCPLRRPCRQLPLQGSLSSGGFKCLPCKGRWMRRRRRRRGAAPGPASIFPGCYTSPAALSHNVNSPAVPPPPQQHEKCPP